jgi:hypothetical protein
MLVAYDWLQSTVRAGLSAADRFHRRGLDENQRSEAAQDEAVSLFKQFQVLIP